MKHYESVEFCQFFNVKPPRTKAKLSRRHAKPPIENFLATVLATTTVMTHLYSRNDLETFSNQAHFADLRT